MMQFLNKMFGKNEEAASAETARLQKTRKTTTQNAIPSEPEGTSLSGKLKAPVQEIRSAWKVETQSAEERTKEIAAMAGLKNKVHYGPRPTSQTGDNFTNWLNGTGGAEDRENKN